MNRNQIQIDEVLIDYDGPQLVTGHDFYGSVFLCAAVPDEKDAHKFFGSRIGPDHLRQFYSGRIDLHYALTYERRPKYITFSFSGNDSIVPSQKFKKSPPDEWLPERGFFWERSEEFSEAGEGSVTVGIDGRWDIQDLADYPQKLAAPYAFLYGLKKTIISHVEAKKDLFIRYPWRGGFSTVNFYRDLYALIPPVHRVIVEKIKYASPGEIQLQADSAVIEELHTAVAAMENLDSYGIYQQLRRDMSNFGFLGRSPQEMKISAAAEEILEAHCRKLAHAISFTRLAELYELSGENWAHAAKLLLAYYRRLEELAEFYESGKAEYRGSSYRN